MLGKVAIAAYLLAVRSNDLATVDGLAELLGSRERAIDLLERLGVEHVNGVFVLAPFLDAQAEQLRATSRSTAPDDPVAIAKEVLARYGISVVDVLAGKRLTLLLRGTEAARCVVTYDLKKEVAPVWIPAADDRRAKATAMCVYTTTQRRSGSPQFLASGIGKKGAPELYLFVLSSERRAWILTHEDLKELLRETGRSRRENFAPQLGFAEHAGREGTLRLWMPMGNRTGADLSERIAGPDGLILGEPPRG